MFLLQFIFVSIERIQYPFELEWNEGDIGVAAIRVSEGMPLYPPPEAGYVPYFYPPLYPMVLGVLFKLYGASLTIGRALSFIATLGLGAVLGAIVYKWSRNLCAALFTGLFYIATYKVSGFWMDLTRIDSFAWFMSFACVMLIFTPKRPSYFTLVIASLVAVGAAFSKQNATLPVLAGALFLFLYYNKRGGIFFVIGAILTVNIFWYVCTKTENTWFLKYYYQIASKHPVFWNYLVDKNRIPKQFFTYVSLPLLFLGGWLALAWIYSFVAMVMGILRHVRTAIMRDWVRFAIVMVGAIAVSAGMYIFLQSRIPKNFPREALPYIRAFTLVLESWIVIALIWKVGIATGDVPGVFKRFDPLTPLWFTILATAATFGGIMGYLKVGGFVNNFMPLLAVMALLLGIAFHSLWTLIPARRNLFFPRVLVHAGILVLVVFILPPFLYEDKRVLPFEGSEKRGEQLIRTIGELPGKVYVPHHNYYAALAGKGMFYSVDAIRDLNWAGIGTPKTLRNALQQSEYDWIVLDMDLRHEWVPGDVRTFIQRNYTSKGRIIQYKSFRELEPVTGCTMKPRLLWQSRKSRLHKQTESRRK